MKHFFRYVIVGALALIPLLIVIQILILLNDVSRDVFTFVSSYTNSTTYTTILFVLITLLLATFGYSIERAGKSFVISTIDMVLEKVPAIGTIYSILKKLTALFTPHSDEKEAKTEVVLVEYPKDDLWVPAYILNKYDDILVLFIPTSPNPTSGYTVITHRDKVRSVSLSLGEASQFIVSMGADFIKKEEIASIVTEEKNR